MTQDIIKALRWRYATKVYDPTKHVSQEDLHTILECGRLSPSSLGIEPWKFLVIENTDVRLRLRAVGFDQSKITDASHLIVIARRTDVREHIAQELIERTAKQQGVEPAALDGLKRMVEGSISGKSDVELDAWVRAQTYIALGMMIEAAALLGVDGGPMEGFVPAEVDKVLGLTDKHLASTSMLALGYRANNDSYADKPKVRRLFEEVIEFVK